MSPVPYDGVAGWPRPRLVPRSRWGGAGLAPACFVQSDAEDPTSAAPARLQHCFLRFACQVCGEDVLSVDTCGWVLEPVANLGGACCTRCMYLALRACPHLADQSPESWSLHPVTDPRHYAWHQSDGRTDGHIVAVASAPAAITLEQFGEHHSAWRRSVGSTDR